MEIPKVELGKIVLIKADYNTGIILNGDGTNYLGKGDDYYTIYDSKEEAGTFVKEQLDAKVNFEFMLYDHKGDFIEVVRPPN